MCNENNNTVVGRLLKQCESIDEFTIRRSFYGFTQGVLTEDEPEDYYVDVGSIAAEVSGSKGDVGAIFDPEFALTPTITEDLLDYSLRGIEALLDELD